MLSLFEYILLFVSFYRPIDAALMALRAPMFLSVISLATSASPDWMSVSSIPCVWFMPARPAPLLESWPPKSPPISALTNVGMSVAISVPAPYLPGECINFSKVNLP